MPRDSVPARHGRGSFDRADSLRRLEEETFDVLVIGGGITGAGDGARCGGAAA